MYKLGTWDYNTQVLNKEMVKVKDSITKGVDISEDCRIWKPYFVNEVTLAANHKKQIQQQQQHARDIAVANAKASASQPRSSGSSSSSNVNNSSNNTVNCYHIADMTYSKEIKTFKGQFCPLGYLPAAYSGL